MDIINGPCFGPDSSVLEPIIVFWMIAVALYAWRTVRESPVPAWVVRRRPGAR